MKIILHHDIMSNVLFLLDDGSRVWYNDMPVNSEMRKRANELLADKWKSALLDPVPGSIDLVSAGSRSAGQDTGDENGL